MRLTVLLHVVRTSMRPLKEEETKQVHHKIERYIGDNLHQLLERPDGAYRFCLQNNRVYYVSDSLLKKSTQFSRDDLVSIGTCFGKFTKSKKFILHVTSLNFLSPYAKHKVWLKPSAEQQFLYGHNVLKSGLGRITDNTSQNQGVVVFNMNDLPLGFGIAARSTDNCRNSDPGDLVCIHQADIGEYLRNEDNLV